MGETSKAKKHDNGKPQLSACPLLAFQQVVRVMTDGAKKYSTHNYLNGQGLNYSRPLDAAWRHLEAYLLGERIDSDSGNHHLACCGAEVMMALELELQGKSNNDLYYHTHPRKTPRTKRKRSGGSRWAGYRRTRVAKLTRSR